MKGLRKTSRILLKAIASVIVIAVAAAAATSVSPIYDFKEPRQFEGPDIYDPYRNLDTAISWKKANFHTPTRVEGITNECEYWPDEVLKRYEDLGYDIVTFSNHNELTDHPRSKDLQVNVYEHGYNLFKFHKLTFGAEDVRHFDHLLPLFASQKQFQIDLLSKDADIIQVNHPLRTPTLSKSQLEKISGYRLIELDSGKSTENEYWDWALSAGRYSFGLANDDLHFPDQSDKIARRCNFLCTPSAKYEDLLNTLKDGCFYSMRISDYGNGDWEAKKEGNRHLPYIKGIGLRDSTIHIQFSEPASLIKVTGQNHSTLSTCNDCDTISYTMKASDPYARITAFFPDGEVIYTNPFARYDSTVQSSPFDDSMPPINIFLTILFNLLLLAICVADGYILYRYIFKK